MQEPFKPIGNQQALAWHPQWRVFHHNEQGAQPGIVLISESQTLWLDSQQFPGVDLIDGQRSSLEILDILNQQPNMVSHGARFLYQLNQLHSAAAICSVDDEIFTQYFLPDATQPISWLRTEGSIKVASLSQNTIDWQLAWCETLLLTLNSYEQELVVLLVDELFDSRIEAFCAEQQNYLVIKISGENFAISPAFISDCYHYRWPEFSERLAQNQPVRISFSRCYPQQAGPLPIGKNGHSNKISEGQWLNELSSLINLLMTEQLTPQTQAHLLTVAVDWQQPQLSEFARHPVVFAAKNAKSLELQIQQPIKLTECLSVFDKDGGSRSLTPDQTVAKLEPLIDAMTGVINYVDTLKSFAGDPIKIFGTAFFKTPTKRQLQQIDNNSFTQSCLGKGVSHIQSKASALCETIERYNAHYRGDVKGRLMSQSQLSSQLPCVGFSELLPYSESQLRLFADSNHPESKRKQAALVYNDQPVRWLPTWSLRDERQVWVPLSLCFSQVPYDDEQFGRWSSNGCAAGNSIEEAILQALLELIERDAAAIWWYNRVPRASFDLTRLDADNFAELERSLSHSHEFWVLDITTDVGIPAMVAIGRHKENNGYIMGMGCHIRPELAAQRALTELCQLIPIRDQNDAPFDFDAMVESDYLHPDTSVQSMISEQLLADKISDKDIKHQVEFVVSRLSLLGFDTLVLDYSRDFIPLKTAKVFVPGLTHIWPQLANSRLYQAPVEWGLTSSVLDESQLNPQALYI